MSTILAITVYTYFWNYYVSYIFLAKNMKIQSWCIMKKCLHPTSTHGNYDLSTLKHLVYLGVFMFVFMHEQNNWNAILFYFMKLKAVIKINWCKKNWFWKFWELKENFLLILIDKESIFKREWNITYSV